MKKCFLHCLFFIFYSTIVSAQNAKITTIAGYGAYLTTCDNCPATSTALLPYGINADPLGNIYVSESFGSGEVIRRINSAGFINVVAGGGSPYRYSGPATSVLLSAPSGIATDDSGNYYIGDGFSFGSNNYVWKVNAANMIRVFAGNGTVPIISCIESDTFARSAGLSNPTGVAVGSDGKILIATDNAILSVDTSNRLHTVAGDCFLPYVEGAPATSVVISPISLAADGVGNVYFYQRYPSVIRKVNTMGVITTVAGNGLIGYSGDGGPATAASISAGGICADQIGNIYFADSDSNLIRKISTSGVISTIAGSGKPGYSGDGENARFAKLNRPRTVAIDRANNLFVIDQQNYSIRKVQLAPSHAADSFSVLLNENCSNLLITLSVNRYIPGMTIETRFGDGEVTTDAVVSVLGGGYVNLNHSFLAPGLYTVKHVLYRGGLPIDSLSYPHKHIVCKTLAYKFYYDYHGSCIYDSAADPLVCLPITAEIDSNGVAIDTVSFTSGFYYDAKGNPGDIYTCKVLSLPNGYFTVCPTSGIIHDTLDVYIHPDHFVGLSCSTSPGFDLGLNLAARTGRHQAEANVIVYNEMCPSENGVLTIEYSPKYIFDGSSPSPTTIAGNTVSWNMTGVSLANIRPNLLSLHLKIPTSLWLLPGDTIQTHYRMTPTLSGDVDPTDNYFDRVDTVRTSYDPNEVSVTPEGYIPSGVQLQYTIHFENDGNDTAFNIYILDTLSEFLDVKSFRIINASAKMDVSRYSVGGRNIIKFDFPNINLLDSSYHNLCNGMLMFNIKVKNGLSDSTLITNKAGIYFDDNPVVPTNEVVNTICNGNCDTSVTNPTPIGISSKSVGKLSIYPNPANERIYINMDNGAFDSYVISNALGQELIKGIALTIRSQINIVDLPAGFYYITLRGANGVYVQRFTKY